MRTFTVVLTLLAANLVNGFVARTMRSGLFKPTRWVTKAAATADALPNCVFEEVDYDNIVTIKAPGSDLGISCYVAAYAKVDGHKDRFVLASPEHTCAEIRRVQGQTPEDIEGEVVHPTDPLMKELFPFASELVKRSDEGAQLIHSTPFLTVDEGQYDDEDEEDEDFDDDEDDDEDDEHENEEEDEEYDEDEDDFDDDDFPDQEIGKFSHKGETYSVLKTSGPAYLIGREVGENRFELLEPNLEETINAVFEREIDKQYKSEE